MQDNSVTLLKVFKARFFFTCLSPLLELSVCRPRWSYLQRDLLFAVGDNTNSGGISNGKIKSIYLN